jgi:hypothetical protein
VRLGVFSREGAGIGKERQQPRAAPFAVVSLTGWPVFIARSVFLSNNAGFFLEGGQRRNALRCGNAQEVAWQQVSWSSLFLLVRRCWT